jgi:hypothetical protein
LDVANAKTPYVASADNAVKWFCELFRADLVPKSVRVGGSPRSLFDKTGNQKMTADHDAPEPKLPDALVDQLGIRTALLMLCIASFITAMWLALR